MSRHVTIETPVRTSIRIGDQRLGIGAVISVDIPSIDADAAPVVASWKPWVELDYRADYRAFDGRLFASEAPHTGQAVRLGDMKARDGSWKDAYRSNGDSIRLARFPFQHPSASGLGEVDFCASPLDHPEMREAVDFVRDQMAKCVVVGDRVLMPSKGPTLSVLDDPARRGGLLAMTCRPVERSDKVDSTSFRRSLSLFDADAHLEALRSRFKHVELRGELPIVHSLEGWGLEGIREDADAWALRHLLGAMSRNPMVSSLSLSSDAAMAIIQLREAQGEGWSDRILAARSLIDAIKETPPGRETVFALEVETWDAVLSVIESHGHGMEALMGMRI